ncbi:FHA domain-containing protein [Dethiothermospora halolimnae]|uniref:FHA domain-containing protein n=1 Tax=Dethiothermospora halolimnae TaxID=3114390 RepID=UPI003CCC1798
MKTEVSNKIKIMEIFILITSIIANTYIYLYIQDGYLKYILMSIFLIIGIKSLYDLLFKNGAANNYVDKSKGITKIALINEENKTIKEWDLFNKTSIVIGRENNHEEVDINLDSATYASLIDFQHAVLNFASGNWYVEDLYSDNGISIQKYNDDIRYKLSKDRPCKIEMGDILFIAKTKLLIK